MTDEIEAMRTIGDVLSEFDNAEVHRILAWANSKFGYVDPTPRQPDLTDPDRERSDSEGRRKPATKTRYTRAADLLAEAGPSTGAERALVVGYWLQQMEDQEDFASGQVNRELKQLGHGSANITVDFNTLMKQKPQLVIQVSKSGRAQQARKKYRITDAGIARVAEMLAVKDAG